MGRVLAVALVALCLVPLVGTARPARADDVSDLNARARAIATQLADLQGRIADLGEAFNQAQVRSGQLDEEMATTRRRLAQARQVEEARRAEAAHYALVSYVGGNDQTMSLALDGRQWDLTRRNGYASIEIGNRQQLVDDLLAASRSTPACSPTCATPPPSRSRSEPTWPASRPRPSSSWRSSRSCRTRCRASWPTPSPVSRPRWSPKQRPRPRARAATTTSAPSVTETGSGATPSSEPTAVDPTGSAPPATTRRPGGTGQTTTPPATTTPAPPPPVVTPPPVVNPPPPSRGGQVAANAARSQLGVRYSWGGGNASGPSYGFGAGAGVKGFDCSGLTLYAWAQAGVHLYHSAQVQYDQSRRVSLSQLQVGDLVFYGSSSTSIDHVALYIGNGQVIHAPNSRTVVQVGPVSLWNGYFAWSGAGRPG